MLDYYVSLAILTLPFRSPETTIESHLIWTYNKATQDGRLFHNWRDFHAAAVSALYQAEAN